MTDYEKSLEAAVNGNLDALGLLQSNAEQGDADAQFCLSRYYLAVRDMDNYNYWSEKAYQNGYIDDESIIKEKMSGDQAEQIALINASLNVNAKLIKDLGIFDNC